MDEGRLGNLGKVEKLLEDRRKGKRKLALNCSLQKYIALWDCLSEVKGSPFTKRMERLSGILKRA